MNAILIQGGAEVPAPADLAQLCLDAWTLSQDIDTQTKDLNDKKKRISEALDFEGTVLIPGTCRVNVTERKTVSVANEYELRATLKEKFDPLVEMKLTWRARDGLKEIALNSAHPLHKSVVRWLKIAKSYPVVMESDAPKDAA